MMEFDFKLEPGRQLLDRELIKTGAPMVSIITPYYNAGKYFEQTYNCVLNQTFPFFEWVIVNDGSTDLSDAEALKRLAETDPRIVLLQKENGGPASARNLAIKNAKTDIIVTLDSDDLIEPTYIEELYWGLRCHPDAGCCYTNSVGFQGHEYLWNRPFNAGLLCVTNFLNYSAVFRSAVLFKVGLYDEIQEKYYDEDWKLWLKLFSTGIKPVRIASYGFWYRRLDTGVRSLTRNDPKLRRQSNRMIQDAARAVDVTVKAIEYPRAKNQYCNDVPCASDWNMPFYIGHEENHILLLPDMPADGFDNSLLDAVRRLDTKKINIGVIFSGMAGNSQLQKLRVLTPDLFVLPDFLDMDNWAEFIDYYIKSRQVKVVIFDNLCYGNGIQQWLKRENPDLIVLDYTGFSNFPSNITDEVISKNNSMAPNGTTGQGVRNVTVTDIFCEVAVSEGVVPQETESTAKRIIFRLANYKIGRVLLRVLLKLKLSKSFRQVTIGSL